MAGLSTHVLDTSTGLPASGLRIELWNGAGKKLLNTAVTNTDGRTDAPLLEAANVEDGFYEIRFYAGDYLVAQTDDEAFYDVISIRFRFDTKRPHHHIPLLLSPFGYSTYRGS